MVLLFEGDCLDVMREMKDDFIDLTVTSPPYDGIRTYHGFSFNFEDIARELYRVTKKGGVVTWVVGDETRDGSESGTSFRQALFFMECGFNLHDTMIYEKVNYVPLTHNRYEQAFDYMFVLSKGRPKTFNPLRIPKRSIYSKPGKFHQTPSANAFTAAHSPASATNDKISPNIWRYSIGRNKSGHPAVFPDQLAQDHIVSWSNPGDLVMDPFLGSGTTGRMCVLTGRDFIGIEISPEFFRLAKSAIDQSESDQAKSSGDDGGPDTCPDQIESQGQIGNDVALPVG